MTDHSCYDLPVTRNFNYFEPEDGGSVQFRLTYTGDLPSANGKGRTGYKHRLRKHFHKQLKELWKLHPNLREQSERWYFKETNPDGETVIAQLDPPAFMRTEKVKTWVDHIADDHQRCGTKFVPLVSKKGGFTCSLDILLMRRDNPGSPIVHGSDGGDLDNRIKILFDGLRMPETVTDLGGLSIEQDESPFFCLLEDDRLVSNLSVTTDYLLASPTDEDRNHVSLIIHVTVVDPSALFVGNRLV